MRTTLLLLLSLLTLSRVSAQTDTLMHGFIDKLVDPYLEYFSLPREHVYTHFNKSGYIPGDDIWFKCYVINPETKQPSHITSNLIVELYYPDGRLLKQKVLYVENGTAANVFQLDVDDPGGRYTFRAYTSWMKNFTDLTDVSTFLTVLGEEQGLLKTEEHYDLQFLPESGTFLEGLINKVAIKAVDPNGMGVSLKGDIMNEAGESVRTFELNELGMGNLSLTAIANMKLHARIVLPDSRELTYPFPEAEKQGIIAQVNVFRNDIVFVNIATNSQTLSREQTVYLMIHGNGNVNQLASLRLGPAKTSHTLMFKKSTLLNGVNCLTIFNEDMQPVAERLFYVSNTRLKGGIRIDEQVTFSTVSLKTTATDTLGNPALANFSISVLPGGSSSGKFTNSLLSDILLQSGVRGQIESPDYYFAAHEKERVEAMDNLLLTQGWRKYNWEQISGELAGTLSHSFEKGFTLSGEVKGFMGLRSDVTARVSFMSAENNLFDSMHTDSLGRFSFVNLFFPEMTHVFLTAVNEKGRGWNREISSQATPIYTADSIIDVPNRYRYQQQESEPPPPPSLISDVIELEGATIVAKKPEVPFENNIYKPSMGRTVVITEENVNTYHTMQDLLLSEFNVRANYNDERGDWDIDMGRGGITLSSDNPNPAFVMNDVIYPDFHWLFNMSMHDIEAIAVDKTGFGLGTRGAAGAIMVQTRTTPLYEASGPTNSNSFMVRGFADPVAYYLPKYDLRPPDPDFINHATLFWHPMVFTDDNGEATMVFEFPFSIDAVDVRIEGITDDGIIFLENQSIPIHR